MEFANLLPSQGGAIKRNIEVLEFELNLDLVRGKVSSQCLFPLQPDHVLVGGTDGGKWEGGMMLDGAALVPRTKEALRLGREPEVVAASEDGRETIYGLAVTKNAD